MFELKTMALLTQLRLDEDELADVLRKTRALETADQGHGISVMAGTIRCLLAASTVGEAGRERFGGIASLRDPA
jgi:hypothetical protein